MGFSSREYWSGLPFPYPRGSSWLRDRTQVSCITGGFFTVWATREAWTAREVPPDLNKGVFMCVCVYTFFFLNHSAITHFTMSTWLLYALGNQTSRDSLYLDICFIVGCSMVMMWPVMTPGITKGTRTQQLFQILENNVLLQMTRTDLSSHGKILPHE